MSQALTAQCQTPECAARGHEVLLAGRGRPLDPSGRYRTLGNLLSVHRTRRGRVFTVRAMEAAEKPGRLDRKRSMISSSSTNLTGSGSRADRSGRHTAVCPGVHAARFQGFGAGSREGAGPLAGTARTTREMERARVVWRGRARSSRAAANGTAAGRSDWQEPADAVLNTAAWQGGRCAPLRPPASRAAERSADGRGRPRLEPRRRCARA